MMKDLKYLVQNIAKPIIRKNGFVTPQIIFDWPLIVGEYLAKYTTPLKIVFPAQKNINGTLHIEVYGAQSPIIQQLEQEIVEKIATYFGFKAISKIKLIHSKDLPKDELNKKELTLSFEEAKKLDNMLAGVEDAELRERLKAIGTIIIKENSSE